MQTSDLVIAVPDGGISAADVEDAPATDGKADVSVMCGICPSPPSNGHSTCNDTTCGIQCDMNYRNCPGTQTCTKITACCSDAECPKNTPACVSGQCKARANNDPCTADTECGSGHCSPTASGATTKVCCDSDCSGSCNAGCAAGTCQHKTFRTACGEIDYASYTPRYSVCDGNGNCNPPGFFCGGFGNVCQASKDVICCGDPNNGYMLGCITPAVCATQGVGNFEMSCSASVDCPASTFCCSIQNQDVLVTGCASNCLTFSIPGLDPTQYTHNQMCDPIRDPSCPVGKKCQVDQVTDLGMCL